MIIDIPKIGDIMTTDLLYYSKELEEDCKAMCLDYNITYMPVKDKDGFCVIHNKENDKFEEQKIPNNRKIKSSVEVFDNQVLNKFKDKKYNHEVLFVYEEGDLKGVIHICDYNNPAVQLYLFEMLMRFEQTLRDYLLNKFSTKNTISKKMLEYLKEQYGLKGKRYKDFKNDYKRLNHLQGTYLSDLLEFTVNPDYGHYPIEHYKNIRMLRNQVAHSNDFIHSKQDDDEISFEYESKFLEALFNRYRTLEKEYKKLKNHIQYG